MTAQIQRNSKGRARGNSLPHAKLDPEKVRLIRANINGLTDAQRAAEMNVHPNVIFRVRNFESWTHI